MQYRIGLVGCPANIGEEVTLECDSIHLSDIPVQFISSYNYSSNIPIYISTWAKSITKIMMVTKASGRKSAWLISKEEEEKGSFVPIHEEDTCEIVWSLEERIAALR